MKKRQIHLLRNLRIMSKKPARLKILVTGGAGFLGSNLIACLLDQGHSVVCIDNLYTGTTRNIEQHLQNPNFVFLNQDVCEKIDIEVNQIYNLACPASPPHYQRNPIQTVKTCVLGALNVLDLSVRCGARVLQASTSEVYGDPLVHPQPESYWGNVNPVGIRSCYDEGKRCAETLFFDYKRHHHADVRVARIFNTYGPKMDPKDGRVVSNFIIQALNNQDITVYGSGSQTRSFCFVTDLVDGLMRLMNAESPVEVDSPIHGPVNLGNPKEFTVLELAKAVIALTKSKSRISFKPLPADDPRQRQPNIRTAIEHLDWRPQIALEEGLDRTIAYFKSTMTIETA